MAAPIPGSPQLPKGFLAVPRGHTQQQLGLLQQLGPMGLAGLQQAQNIDPILQQARTGFAQQTVPSLAERFTSMGGYGTGALSSPAFASQLGAAGAGLEQSLAALSSQHQQALLPLFLKLLGMGLEPEFDIAQKPREPGFFERLFGGASQGAATALPLLLSAGTGGLGLPASIGLAGVLGGLQGVSQSRGGF